MKNSLDENPSLGLKQSLMIAVAGLLRYFPWKAKVWFWLHSQPAVQTSFNYYVKAHFPEGYTLVLNLKEFWQRLMLAGCYDIREFWVIKSLLKPGNCFFDIGANIGFYAVAMGKLLGSEGKVYAFEPHPGMAAQLRSSLEENPELKIKLYETAVWKQTGETSFFIPPDNGFQSVEGSVVSQPDFTEKKVPCVTLDDICHESAIKRITLAKIDVEGGERQVFEGAQNVLKTGILESILCEVNDQTRQSIFSALSCFPFEKIIDLRTMKSVTAETIGRGQTNVIWLRGEGSRRWQDLGWKKWLI